MDSTAITEALTTAASVGTQAVTFLAGNALCMVYVGIALFQRGFGIFGSAKNAAM